MPLGTDVGLGPGDIVLDEDPATPKNGTAPQFSAHVYGGQTAVCVRIPLGTEVGLSSGRIVLHGDTAPNFRPMSVVAERSPILVTAERALVHAHFGNDCSMLA